ncbi:MAG: 50S ribosomal protein L9 [Anaerolineales bacterium]|jgi:large subunit ribosomal protein L9
MKVLLLEDVYKLGRAGEVKKVAPGYGRNFLIPQGLAVLATPGAMKQAERIKTDADAKRAVLNKEMNVIAERLQDVTLTFPARASETGRLYGSINTRMMAEAVSEEAGIEISHRQVESQPLRMIGEHSVEIRLTVDQIPKIRAIVYREGETPALALEEEAAREAEAAPSEPFEAVEAVEASAEVSEYDMDAVAEPAEAVEASTTESEAEAEAESASEEPAEVEALGVSATISEAEEEAETEISEPAEAVEASTTESEADAEAAPSEPVDEAEVSEEESEEEAKAEAEVELDLESEAEESEETPPEAVEE